MNITTNKRVNLDKAVNMIKDAKQKYDSDIIVLPEMFNCPYNYKYIADFSEDYPGESTILLSNLARKLKIYLIGGSIPEKDGNRMYNTSYIFGKEGKLIGKHRKIHLFDVNI